VATFLVMQHLVRGFQLTDEEAVAVAQPWNASCQPPWDEKELHHKARQAREKGSAIAWGAHVAEVTHARG
jgi:hypothetical protein